MEAKKFKEGFFENDKIGDGIKLVNKLTPEEAKKIYEATIKGDQSNYSATIKGDIIIYNMKNGSKETQKLLDEFTKLYENDWRKCTFDNFVKWMVKNKGKVKQ